MYALLPSSTLKICLQIVLALRNCVGSSKLEVVKRLVNDLLMTLLWFLLCSYVKPYRQDRWSSKLPKIPIIWTLRRAVVLAQRDTSTPPSHHLAVWWSKVHHGPWKSAWPSIKSERMILMESLLDSASIP